MRKGYVLALDQGTTGSRAFLFDEKGRIVTSSYKEFKQYFPHPGWVEHDAQEIWQSCVFVIKQALKKGNISSKKILAIGITNQRETTVLWDRKTSEPVARAIVWQCRRTEEICSQLKRKGYENIFRRKTGLLLDPYFSGTKIKWSLNQKKSLHAKARDGRLCFGTIDSWLIWKLTGGRSHVTDFTNASRTLMFNIKTLHWDKELLKVLNVPSKILPRVQKSGSLFGRTHSIAGLSSGTPITAVLGDQQAALYGQGCYRPGTIKNTYGTGCFMVLNTGKNLVYPRGGLLSTIASDDKGNPIYAIEGSIFIAGAVVQWMRDQMKIIKSSSDAEKFIKGLKDTAGVYIVPAFTGLGAPYWDSAARGIITGLTRGTNQKHILRAGLESIAYQTKDVFELMKKEAGKNIKELKVDGGACRNNFLMQFQADILGCHLVRPEVVESTAQGAAYLAGVSIGLWNGEKDLRKMQKTEKIFKPAMRSSQRSTLYKGWITAVEKAMY